MDHAGLLGWLVERIAARTGVVASQIDAGAPLLQLGVDSLGAVALTTELSACVGRELPVTFFWENPTIEAAVRALTRVGEPGPLGGVAGQVAAGEPIAVVGVACRLPGAPDPDSFWRLLHDGVDAVGDVPAGRWDPAVLAALDQADRVKVSRGAFLSAVDGFDADFFRVMPSEALAMDPQQRLLLELAWEALEGAAIPPGSLKDSQTGVFIGAIWQDYDAVLAKSTTPMGPYTATGLHRSVLANRLSYALGLHGPSFAVDSACSSSLLAVHLAVASLRAGECRTALVGGVSLNLLAESAIATMHIGALSPTGACHTFDARADGYVRGEGGVLFVLQPLSAALAAGSPILGLVRGTAVNNDGATNGLTAPSPVAQAAVLRGAWAQAAVLPAQVHYVEAHGTGTPLGDPIEASALGAVFGPRAGGERLIVGSVKTQIGHLEGAAGAAGMLKAVLALDHAQIPANLHFAKVNPEIDLPALGLDVPSRRVPWPEGGGRRLAGVSSFGFGGTNAHVALEAWSLRQGAPAPASLETIDASGGVVFVFAGQGGQWAGGGRTLLQREPVFRATLARCSQRIERSLGWSLLDRLARAEATDLHDSWHGIPTSVALAMALADWWRAAGVSPTAVIGSSTGQMAAAYAAGALSLEDTMRVACAYGSAFSRREGEGALAWVALSWSDAERAVEGHAVRPVIEDGPIGTVVGGQTRDMAAWVADATSRGLDVRPIAVGVAPHHPDPQVRADLLAALDGLHGGAPTVPMIDGRTGGWVDAPSLDAAFWVDAAMSAVRVRSGLDRLVEDGARVFLEVGSHPLLRRPIEAVLSGAGVAGVALASLKRGADERPTLATSAAALRALGLPTDEAALDAARAVAAPVTGGPTLLVLSAKTDAALRARAGDLARALQADASLTLADVATTLAYGREPMRARASCVVRSRAEAVTLLEQLAEEGAASGAATGHARRAAVVFVFPGQGSQWVGMCRDLLAHDRVFADALAAAAREVSAAGGPDVLAAVEHGEFDEIGVVQPLLFAIQVALVATWAALGVRPAAVVGHSMGEVAAAVVAGRLSLADGAKVIVRRSALLRRVRGQGAMALVELSVPEAEAAIAGAAGSLAVAVSNAPRSTVLAGDGAALDAVLATLEARGVFCRRVKVDVASHSPQVDVLLDDLEAQLGDLSPSVGAVPFWSTVRGVRLDGEPLDARYWVHNLRDRVRFGETIGRLGAETDAVFVEISPHPVLLPAVEETLRERAPLVVPTLRRGADERASVWDGAGRLWTRGVDLAWPAVLGVPGRLVRLPTYPWQRERAWPTPSTAARRAVAGDHPWLTAWFEPADRVGACYGSAQVDVDGPGAVAQHAVGEQIVLPGAASIELLIAAARRARPGLTTLHDVTFERPVLLARGEVTPLQVEWAPQDDGGARVALHVQRDGVWAQAAVAKVDAASSPPQVSTSFQEVLARCPRVVPVTEHLARLERSGLRFGPAYQGLTRLQSGAGEAIAEITLRPEAGAALGFVVPPTLLDAALQASLATHAEPAEGATWVPATCARVHVLSAPPPRARVTVARRGDGADVVVWDAHDRPAVVVEGLTLARLDLASLGVASVPLWRTRWRPLPQVRPRTPAAGEPWVLLLDQGGVGSALAQTLRGRGCRVVEVSAGDEWAATTPDQTVARPRNLTDATRVLRERAVGDLRGVVNLRALDLDAQGEAPADGLVDAVAALLGMARAALSAAGRDAPRVVSVTRGAVGATTGDVVSPWAAPLWGFSRVVQLEQPDLDCRCVDLPAGEVSIERLADALLADDAEELVALRAAGRLGARLTALALPSAAPPRLRGDATYLVTGGLGGLGLSVARWLALAGAGHLVLVGRSAPSAAALEQIAALEAIGAQVHVRRVDVSSPGEVDALVAWSLATLPPLRGVVHAAGVLVDATLPNLEVDALWPAMAPKVAGAWNLHHATRALPLDLFVMYGSAAALLGSPGQANYAAGNAFLAALAEARVSAGLPARCLEWGAFAEIGLAAARADRGERLALGGLASMTPDEGLDALARALASDIPVLGPIRLSPRQWRDTWPQAAASPFLSELARDAAPARDRSFADALAARPAEERAPALLVFLTERLAGLLRRATSEIGPTTPLRELGVDSLMSLEVRNRLEGDLGVRLSASLLFTHPTLQALTEHLLGLLGPGDVASERSTSPTLTRPAPDEVASAVDAADEGRADLLAVIGVACRLPGGGDTPERFFDQLLAGADSVVAVPVDRWTDADPTSRAVRWGGFLSSPVDGFDCAYFGMSPREADWLDPQQRLLLEVSAEALERAGQSMERLLGSRSAVFVGCMGSDYAELGQRLTSDSWDAYTATGANHCFPAGRLSYTFGLQGPAAVVDTACSSSLVALHLACGSLRLRESDLAIVGGVSLMLTSTSSEMTAHLRALSPDGRCRTFDARANGYVRGEGCGVMVLKRLDDALRDRDPVLAVVRGSAVNQDGRSSGLTAPNGRAQEALIREALERARCAPAQVGYVETHGTGTSLGDPIEVSALSAVVGAPRADGAPCVLGAVKTNIGHLEAAAGMASVLKVIGALQREVIPPNLNFKSLNPRIELDGTSLVVPTAPVPWPRGVAPRVAGVSGFGLSGTNAHVVFEEAPASAPRADLDGGPQLIVVSAKSEAALRRQALAYADALAVGDLPLPDVAYTALMRRTQHPHRLAVVGDRASLVGALRRFGEGEDSPDAAHGQASLVPSSRVVFVCSGQGSQWPGMCRDLARSDAAFSSAFFACADAVAAVGGPDLRAALASDDDATADIGVVQPLLFAVQVALAASWRALGVEPTAVIGHSLGEVSAAVIAGCLSLEAGARVIVLRSDLLRRVRGLGGMAVVELSEDEARAAIAPEPDLSVAVVNGPRSTVIAGQEVALARALAALEARGVFCRRVKVDVASHSPQVAPLLDELVRGLDGLTPRAGDVPFWSTVSADVRAGESLDAAYWARNLRETVRFAETVSHAAQAGASVFVELAPHPVLVGAMEETLRAQPAPTQVVGTLRRGVVSRTCLLEALGRLHVAGRDASGAGMFRGDERVVLLPTHPFLRERHWLEGRPRVPSRARTEASGAASYTWSWAEAPADARAPGRWVIVADDARVGAAVRDALDARAGEGVVRAPGPDDAVLYLPTPAEPDGGDAARRLRDLIGGGATRIAVATCGAWSGADPASAACWGLARVATAERTGLKLSMVDVESSLGTPDGAAALVALLGGLEGGDEIALRDGRRVALRLERVGPVPSAPVTASPLGADAAWLVTGGFGGLGLAVCERLVSLGVRHLCVVSRRGAQTDDARAAVARWEALGVSVNAPAVDVSDAAQVDALVAGWPARWPRLSGVFHAAMVLDDGPLLDLTDARVRAVMGPKALGAWNLHVATQRLALDAFVLCSSVAAAVGSEGQGSYAAANAFLEALVTHRRARGLCAAAIAWGAIGEVGAVARSAGLRARLEDEGVRLLPLQSCLATLEPALRGESGCAVVADMDWARWSRAHRAAARAPRLSHLVPAPAPSVATPTDAGDAAALRALPPEARGEALRGVVLRALARVLRADPSRLDADTPLASLGLDSIMSIDLRDRLQTALGVELTVAEVLTAASATALIACLAPRVGVDHAPPDTMIAAGDAPPASWLIPLERRPDAALRLFCFPYAGGSASVFQAWAALLPLQVEPWAVAATGRAHRLTEAPLHDVDAIVDAIVADMLPCLDRPFAVFGHCLGAVIASEVVRRLERLHGLRPLHLFASAAPAPQRYLAPQLSGASEVAFTAALREIGFADERVLQDAEALAALLPAVRADFDAAARYVCRHGEPSDVPVTAFCGVDDFFATRPLVADWAAFTRGAFALVDVPGGHYFIEPEREAVVGWVGLTCTLALAAAATPGGADLVVRPATDTPTLRLVVLPGLGRGPAALDGWRAGPSTEVVVLSPPGIAPREDELPWGDLAAMTERLAPQLLALPPLPTELIGVEGGALLAARLTARLESLGQGVPARLWLAGAAPPHLHALHAMQAQALPRLRLLLGLAGYDTSDVPEPALRAATAALAGGGGPKPALRAAVVVLWGPGDLRVHPAASAAWASVTSGDFALHEASAPPSLGDLLALAAD